VPYFVFFEIAMPSSEFGFVTSAFGISKLLGNIPSGYLVEQYGRKPVIIAGMGLCAVGMGSIGLTLLPGFGTPWWIGCRLLSGLGVSMFVAGGTMYMTGMLFNYNIVLVTNIHRYRRYKHCTE
jgi:MFS family permease